MARTEALIGSTSRVPTRSYSDTVVPAAANVAGLFGTRVAAMTRVRGLRDAARLRERERR